MGFIRFVAIVICAVYSYAKACEAAAQPRQTFAAPKLIAAAVVAFMIAGTGNSMGLWITGGYFALLMIGTILIVVCQIKHKMFENERRNEE